MFMKSARCAPGAENSFNKESQKAGEGSVESPDRHVRASAGADLYGVFAGAQLDISEQDRASRHSDIKYPDAASMSAAEFTQSMRPSRS
jgi:hypothetical protein